MSYAGSFNGFTFGTGARPGASVARLTGWRRKRATFTVTEGATRNTAAGPAASAVEPVLELNLHAETPEELDTLVDQALAAFTPSATPLPLVIAGRQRWVQVVDADPKLAPEWPGPEKTTQMVVSFVAADPVLYDATPTTYAKGSAGASWEFEAANAGTEVPDALRAWSFTITAASTLTNPRIRVDHVDGSFEQVTFQGLTMTTGQVLTVSELIARVGSQRVSGYIRSLTQRGTAGRTFRAWRLLGSTGSDGRNDVTVSAESGTFTGSCSVRGTR